MVLITIDEYIVLLQTYDVWGAVLIIASSVVVAILAKYILKIFAWQLAKKTKTNLDDELLHALETPVLVGIILAGIITAAFTIHGLAARTELMKKIAVVIGVMWFTLTITRVVKAVFKWYEHEIAAKTDSEFDDKYIHIIRRVINIFIIVMAVLILLHHLGIEISPLLAGLGIGGLAVALALQDSLGNFFAGFYTMTERAIKIGDYIETDSGVKGFVKDINWRTARIQMLDNNMIIIPNSKLSQSTVTNYDSPNSAYALGVAVGVGYDSDLAKVEKVCIKVGNDVLRAHKEQVKDAAPVVRYREFGDSSINLQVFLTLKNYKNRFIVKHEYIKALKKEFDKQKIEIPYPQRVVHMKR